jgi:hypothetical protein
VAGDELCTSSKCPSEINREGNKPPEAIDTDEEPRRDKYKRDESKNNEI